MGLNEYTNQNLMALKLIIIGIGRELIPYEARLKGLCESNEQGKYISVQDTAQARIAIQQAFEKVSELISQINTEEFVEE